MNLLWIVAGACGVCVPLYLGFMRTGWLCRLGALAACSALAGAAGTVAGLAVQASGRAEAKAVALVVAVFAFVVTAEFCVRWSRRG